MLHDIRYALRGLGRRPGFAIAAIVTLAVGIGAVTSIFSVADAVLLKPLPFPHQDRLMMVWDQLLTLQQDRFPLTSRTFDLYRREDHLFEAAAAFMQADRTVTGGAGSESIPAIWVSDSLLSMLGANPVIGRAFTADEYRPGHANAVMLSHRYFERRFGGDPAIVGKSVRIDSQEHTVVGVMAPRFEFSIRASDVDLWTPLPMSNDQRWGRLSMIARLRPDVSLASAQSALSAVAKHFDETEHPYRGPHGENAGYRVKIISLREQLLGSFRFATLTLLAAVLAVLLIACANVANLLLVRTVSREKETAVRRALGASNGQLVRQWMTESAVLAFLGGLLGTIAANWAVRILVVLSPASLPSIAPIHVDARALIFTLIISSLTCVFFGLAPSIAAVRLHWTMRSSRPQRRTASALVATEVAVALVLLVGAGLLLKSFVRLTSVDPGFRPDHLLTMQIQFPPSRPVQRAQSIAFFSELRERLAALPGVTAASAVSRLPALGGGSNTRGGNPFSIEGRTWSPSSLAHTPVVALDYFRTMQIPLIAGRIFTEADKADRNVAIVNETFTRLFFPNGDAIGHRVGLGGARPETPWSTIVGVVADVKTARLDQDTMPQIYFPHSQSPSPVMTLILRTSYDLPTTARAVAATINQLDPEMPVYDIKTMEERIAQSVGQPRFQTTLLAWFATVALFLAGIGIFGVVAHSTEQRTHEIGIRMALGADSERVLGYVVANGLRPVLIGLLIGIAGSLAAGRLLATALFHVTATDPVTFTLATVVLGLVAVMACLGPARKATRVDPMIALRAE